MMFGTSSSSTAFYNTNNICNDSYFLNPPQLINFKAIKDNQMVNSQVPTQNYSKSYSAIESSELLYKIFRGETKLVRSILEANGFSHTESHDWNVLWSNSGCKTYLYEGLNEYQKINHFPNSNEITRKDKLCQNVVKM